MVWSTTQSALYNDLSRYYDDEKRTPDPKETVPQEFEKKIPPKRPEDHSEKECDNRHETNCNIHSENVCKNPPKIGADTHMNCSACPRRQSSTQNPLSQLFSDKDMLLIAGLIFLLSKQGADKKLILALAFVLLS